MDIQNKLNLERGGTQNKQDINRNPLHIFALNVFLFRLIFFIFPASEYWICIILIKIEILETSGFSQICSPHQPYYCPICGQIQH